MSDPGRFERALSLRDPLVRSAVVNIVRCQHRDAAMAMLGVVPREERSTVARGVVDVGEAPRETGVVLQCFELRF